MTNHPITDPVPIDFAAAWHSCTVQDPCHRGDAAVDLAYWADHATGYDEDSRTPGNYEGTLAAIQALVRPTDTLLDVGAGAGRFALPLAHAARHVTALDHARPMLALLQQKVLQQRLANVTTVEAAWETATVAPHDVVLAAWSLYRLPDLLAGMQKLIAVTRRTLIIVAGAGHSIRHDPHLRRFWPQADRDDTPMHIYYYGVLWQAGVHPELQIVYDRHQIRGETPHAIARRLAPAVATAAEVDAFCETLWPQLQQQATGWLYEQPVPVGLLIWQKQEAADE
ncbi:MAG: class I SAM-dependent methyltransferase [Caldilineaceae bacterium]|nr:class I SAM-dependent methyltransferase [Caldilineaceae bacterium]